jgi:hypothetical protein
MTDTCVLGGGGFDEGGMVDGPEDPMDLPLPSGRQVLVSGPHGFRG